MDAKTQAKVFGRFERGDESEGGFGIGLDIVSGIVKQYEYSIDMVSKLGEGTTVKLLFSQG
jgi:two-component system OmpR family sensor kinase